MNIYYERQNGGLCRMHALNGYFGYPKITESQFNVYIKEYDIEYKEKYNFESSCSLFDNIASDQKNIVSFILKKFMIYSRYYALNELYNTSITKITDVLLGNYFFIYNENHIWGCKLCDNIWYKIDSITGVTIININSIINEKNIGFIVPVNIKNEFYINLNIIKSIIPSNSSELYIIDFLKQKNRKKLILDNLEIPLNLCMDILDTNLMNKINKSDFNIIKIYVDKYNHFLNKFTNGNYSNINIILEYLPDILIYLISL